MTESEIPQNNDGEIPYLEKKRLSISWPWFFGILGILSIGIGKYCVMNGYTTLAEVFTVIGIFSIVQTLYQMRICNILEDKQHKCMDALNAVYAIANTTKMESIVRLYADMGITLALTEWVGIHYGLRTIPTPEEIERLRKILGACKMNRISFLDLGDVHKEMDWLLSLNSDAVTKQSKKIMEEIIKDGDMMRRISQEMKRDFSGFDLSDHHDIPATLAEQLRAINEHIELWATVLRARYRVDQISLEEAKQLDAEIQELIVKPREQIAEYIKAHYKILVLVSGKQ